MSSASAELIKDLARRARVCGLSTDPDLPQHLRDLVDTADRGQRLLHDAEIQLCCDWSGADAKALIAVQRQASDLVAQARSDLLKEQPQLVQPGGGLFPQSRAEACWRDCFHFLRVSLYGTALRRSQVTDSKGLHHLGQLYALLDVPVPALLLALHHLRRHAVTACCEFGAGSDGEALSAALSDLRNMIRREMKRHDDRQRKDHKADIK